MWSGDLIVSISKIIFVHEVLFFKRKKDRKLKIYPNKTNPRWNLNRNQKKSERVSRKHEETEKNATTKKNWIEKWNIKLNKTSMKTKNKK